MDPLRDMCLVTLYFVISGIISIQHPYYHRLSVRTRRDGPPTSDSSQNFLLILKRSTWTPPSCKILLPFHTNVYVYTFVSPGTSPNRTGRIHPTRPSTYHFDLQYHPESPAYFLGPVKGIPWFHGDFLKQTSLHFTNLDLGSVTDTSLTEALCIPTFVVLVNPSLRYYSTLMNSGTRLRHRDPYFSCRYQRSWYFT